MQTTTAVLIALVAGLVVAAVCLHLFGGSLHHMLRAIHGAR